MPEKKKKVPKKLIIKPKAPKKEKAKPKPEKPKPKPKKKPKKLIIRDMRPDKAQPKKGNIGELRRRPKSPKADDWKEKRAEVLRYGYKSKDSMDDMYYGRKTRKLPAHHPEYTEQQEQIHKWGRIKGDDPYKHRPSGHMRGEPSFLREDNQYGTPDDRDDEQWDTPGKGENRYAPSASFMRRFGYTYNPSEVLGDDMSKDFTPGREEYDSDDAESITAETERYQTYDWA